MKKALLAVLVLVAVGVAVALVWGRDEVDESLTLYGSVDIREVSLSFRQSGRLVSVAVEEGERTAAGDLVATLDAEPLSEAVAVAEARVDLARAGLGRLETGSRPQEIEQARAGVDEAEARLEAARRELERKERLLAAGATSRREVEAAQERFDASTARLDGAREGLRLVREGFRSEDVDAGRAELRLAEAELERARTALADATLRAPSPGTVLSRILEPGTIVAAGAPIVTLSLDDPVVVRAYVPGPHLGAVPPGTLVEVTSDSSDVVHRGRVGFVSPQAEFTPKSVETPELRTDLVYRVRIVVDPEAPAGDSRDPGTALLQGMPVTVRVLEAG